MVTPAIKRAARIALAALGSEVDAGGCNDEEALNGAVLALCTLAAIHEIEIEDLEQSVRSCLGWINGFIAEPETPVSH